MLCLIIRVVGILQFTESIGPLTQIIAKMKIDYINYFILYALLCTTFAIVGNMLFIQDLKDF